MAQDDAGDASGAAAPEGKPKTPKKPKTPVKKSSKADAGVATESKPKTPNLLPAVASRPQRVVPKHLERILARPPTPSDEEMNRLKIKLAGKIERFEYISESHAHFLEVLTGNSKKVRNIITCYNEGLLRKQFQTSKDAIEKVFTFVANKQMKGATLKKRLDIIDKFCLATAGDDYKPDEPAPARVFDEIEKPRLPNYVELFERNDTFWDKRDTLLCSNTLRPYVIPDSLKTLRPTSI